MQRSKLARLARGRALRKLAMEQSNWSKATAQIIVCPKCTVENRAGASPLIERQQDGRWLCSVCCHSWPST